MKTKFLLPEKYGKWGVILFIPSFALGILFLIFEYRPEFLTVNMPAIMSNEIFEETVYFDFVKNNLTDEIISLLLIISLIMIGFSRDKEEDELIGHIRLKSMGIAFLVNYGILILGLLFVYGLSFYMILLFNMFTLLLVYCTIYKVKLYNFKNS